MRSAKLVPTPEPHLGIALLVALALLAPAAVAIVVFALPATSSPPGSSEKTQSPNQPGGERKMPPYFQGPLLYGQADRAAPRPTPAKYLPDVAPGSRIKVPPVPLVSGDPKPGPVSVPVFVRGAKGLTPQ